MTSNAGICGDEMTNFNAENFFLKFLEPGHIRGVKGLCV